MSLSATQKYNLHAVVASLLILIPSVVPITPLMEYAEKACIVFLKAWWLYSVLFEDLC
jgi:hypothetical protein